MEPYFDILVGVKICFPGPLQGLVYSLMTDTVPLRIGGSHLTRAGGVQGGMEGGW